jgi:DNA-binding SARP family transcriptional activator
MQHVTVRLLGGGLTMQVDGRAVAVRGMQARSLLAMLALAGGRPVGITSLVDRLWDARPPGDARAGLHTAVRRLRRLLGPGVVQTRGAAYLLAGQPLVVDAVELADAVTRAWPDPAAERAHLAAAVARWHAEPFSDGFCEWLARYETPRLVELRLGAVERLADLDLAAGRPVERLAELAALVDRHPLRESLVRRLLQGLAAAGRTGEALERYDAVRRHLAAELGIDPGAELQEVHAQLLAAAVAPAPGPPRQLPSAIEVFAGRADVLATLDGLRDVRPGGPIRVVVLHGEAGVGKSAVAVHWAHRNADAFPDGQLFVALCGHGPTEPADAGALLVELLHAGGVEGRRMPAGVQARGAVWRSLAAGRRMLIVLDDARDAEQVRPLLPGSGALVLVTSRTRLDGLAVTAGARHVEVPALSGAEARMVLADAWPGSAGADDAVLDRIAVHCGHLPLALTMAAEQGRRRPGSRPRDVLDRLDSASSRLDELSRGEDPATDLRVMFSWSYRALAADSARLLRLLALHPGRAVGPGSVAALADVPLAVATHGLEQLADRHLLRRQGCCFVLPALLRDYLREQAELQDPEPVRRAAEARVRDWMRAHRPAP